jgi:hypothetical protein
MPNGCNLERPLSVVQHAGLVILISRKGFFLDLFASSMVGSEWSDTAQRKRVLMSTYCSLVAGMLHALPITLLLACSISISAPIFCSFQIENAHLKAEAAGYTGLGQCCLSLFLSEGLLLDSQPILPLEPNSKPNSRFLIFNTHRLRCWSSDSKIKRSRIHVQV